MAVSVCIDSSVVLSRPRVAFFSFSVHYGMCSGIVSIFKLRSEEKPENVEPFLYLLLGWRYVASWRASDVGETFITMDHSGL